MIRKAEEKKLAPKRGAKKCEQFLPNCLTQIVEDLTFGWFSRHFNKHFLLHSIFYLIQPDQSSK